MLLPALIYFPTVFVNSALAFLVYLRNRKSKSNAYFSLVILAVVGWIFTLYLFYNIFDPLLVLLLGRINFGFAILIPYFLLNFVRVFPRPGRLLHQGFENLLFLQTTILFLLTLFTPLIDQDEIVQGASRVTIYGPLYPLFIIHFVFYMLGSLGALLRKLRHSAGLERVQLKFLFAGILLTTIFASITNIFVPLVFSYYDIQNFGPLSTFFFAGFTTYAIIKHRLMDIRLALRAILVRLLIVSVLAAGFFAAVSLFRNLFAPITTQNILLASVLTASLLALLYEPLAHFIKEITDRIFFQKEYSKVELVLNLGKVMSQSLDLEKLQFEIEQTLKEVMRVKFVEFIFQQTRKQEGWGAGNKDILLEQVKVSPQVLVYDELVQDLAEMEEGPQRLRLEQVKEVMRQNEAGVVLPLPSTKAVVGAVLLGEKIGGDAFSSQDLETLETLMYQMATALENAGLFSEIKSFNLKLSQEVKLATADLALKNKNLTVLRRLDEIIINTLDLDEICQKIVDVVAWEAGFLGGLICLLSPDGEALIGQALSRTPALQKAEKLLSKPLQELILPLDLDPSNLLSRAVREHQEFASSSWADFYVPPLTHQQVQKIEEITKIHHHVVYPLSSKGKSLGVVVFGLSKPYSNLSEAEKDLLAAFMDEAGIAVENATLYSDLRRINEELRIANSKLTELDKMKDELVSIASHELRTPMTAIKSYLWLVLHRHAESLTPKLKEYLSRAYESSERMINLVNDMLSVSRIDTGRLQLNLQALNLKVIIESVLEEFAIRAKEEGLKLEFERPETLLPKVLVDPDRIREVLVNLVGNAVKFTGPGGEVMVSARKVGNFVEVAVTDNGPGIPKQDLPRLFQKFGRLSHSFTTAAETAGGTGLGLYIAKGIIDLHNGKIWVKSEAGKGSSFYFTVRVAG